MSSLRTLLPPITVSLFLVGILLGVAMALSPPPALVGPVVAPEPSPPSVDALTVTHGVAPPAAAADVFGREHLPVLRQAARGDLTAAPRAPSRIVLEHEAALRVYFVGEWGDYHSVLVARVHRAEEAPEVQVLFSDASANEPAYESGLIRRSRSTPLAPGDYAELSPLPAGTEIELLLIANGARISRGTYSTDPTRNHDGRSHSVALDVPGAPQKLLAFEDQPDADDFNDVVFAIEVRPVSPAGFLTAD